VEDGLVILVSVSSDNNGADVFTKISVRLKFKKDVDKLMGVQEL
jgi:hypothetical protein